MKIDFIIDERDLNILLDTKNKSLEFIDDAKKFVDIAIVTVDDQNVYLYFKKYLNLPKNKFGFYFFKHNIKITNKNYAGYRACSTGIKIIDQKLFSLLGQFKKIKEPGFMPMIFCPPQEKFLEIQNEKSKANPTNPYNSPKSYLLSIIHEFAHINYFKKQQNNQLKQTTRYFLSELYAFLIEIKASQKIYPKYLENLEKYLTLLKEKNRAEDNYHYLPLLFAVAINKFDLDLTKNLLNLTLR